jgi:hypothetical protein
MQKIEQKMKFEKVAFIISPKMLNTSECWWITPVILAIQEAEIRKTAI